MLDIFPASEGSEVFDKSMVAKGKTGQCNTFNMLSQKWQDSAAGGKKGGGVELFIKHIPIVWTLQFCSFVSWVYVPNDLTIAYEAVITISLGGLLCCVSVRLHAPSPIVCLSLSCIDDANTKM